MYCVDIGMGIACRGVFGWGETIYERSKWNEGRVFVFDVGPGREVEDRDTRGEGIYKERKRRRVVWSWSRGVVGAGERQRDGCTGFYARLWIWRRQLATGSPRMGISRLMSYFAFTVLGDIVREDIGITYQYQRYVPHVHIIYAKSSQKTLHYHNDIPIQLSFLHLVPTPPPIIPSTLQ